MVTNISVIASENFSMKLLETLVIVGEGERLVKHFAFGGLDKAVMLVLGDINTNRNHKKSKPFKADLMLCPTKLFVLNPRAK